MNAEEIYEAIGGDLCICQRADVSHWCEKCQWRIALIQSHLGAHLRAVEAAHQQAIAGLKAELKDVTNAAEDWFKLLQESRSDRERLANESWAAERVAHAITTVELEAAEARLHALTADPGGS